MQQTLDRDREIEAKKELESGQKILASNNIFKKWLGYNKFEDAVRKFEHAGRLYQICKNYDQAVQCFDLAADCYKEMGEPAIQVHCYIQSYNCLKQKNISQSIKYLHKIIDFYNAQCDINHLIKWYNILGDTYELEGNIEQAVSAYKQSISLDDNKNLISYHIKIANYLAQLGKYDEAINEYKYLWTIYLDDKLLRFKIPQLCINLCIVYLCCDDVVNAKRQLNEFIIVGNKTPTIEQFLKNLIEAYESGNSESLTNYVRDYEKFNKLDALIISLLLKIKQNLEKINDQSFL